MTATSQSNPWGLSDAQFIAMQNLASGDCRKAQNRKTGQNVKTVSTHILRAKAKIGETEGVEVRSTTHAAVLFDRWCQRQL